MTPRTPHGDHSDHSPDGFDPHSVPIFPRIAMEISTTENTVTVDGVSHDTDAEDDLIDTAVSAAAARTAAMGLRHARVAAVVDQERYSLVVGADGTRYDLTSTDGTTGKQGPRRPLWPLLVGAAVLMLIVSTSIGVAIAIQQRQTATPVPSAPATPPRAELPVVPTDAWTTRAAWTLPIADNPSSAVIALNATSLFTITPGDTLTAVDPTSGVTQWSSPTPGHIEQGPVLTTIDNVAVVAVVTGRELLWWPVTGAAAPAGQVALDTTEDVTFHGGAPLITGRGQLARIIVDGQPSDRTIPAGAQALRADGTTVLGLNSLGQLWQLDQDTTYVPDPQQLDSPEPTSDNDTNDKDSSGNEQTTPTYLGTHGQVLALQWPGQDQPQIYLYDLTGQPQGEPIEAAGRGWDTAPGQDWAITGTTLINTRSGENRTLEASWRTETIGADIYGTSDGTLVTVDPSTGYLTAQSNPDAQPPLASTIERGYYAAENNDGDPELYAVTPAGQ